MFCPLGSRIKTLARVAIATTLLSMPFSARLYAQNQNTGEIKGTVTDATGARVPATEVVVTNDLTGIKSKVIADKRGSFDVPLLETGRYRLEFTKPGFERFIREGVTLHVEAITIDAVLKAGSITESVVVTSDVPLVQTETSDRRAVFMEDTINDLPNVGRSWYDITGELPGVNPGGSEQDASGQSVGVNGTAGWQENWLVDGGVNTLPVSQNPGNQTPIDDIAEVDMNTSNFSAEYGGGVAVFNVITKSGTNNLHGSLYEFVQNDIFEARNYFAQSRTPLRWNMFGGTVGGPIRRDKAFFFFSYQSNPSVADYPGYYTFPTQAMRNGDFSDPSLPIVYDPATYDPTTGTRMPFPGNIIPTNRIDPLAVKIQSYLPLPNIPGVPAGSGNNYYFVAKNTNTSIAYNGKVSYTLSPANHLSMSTMFNPGGSFTPGPVCPIGTGNSGGCTKNTGMTSQFQVTDTWMFSPSVINDARISFLREFGTWFTPDQGQGFPAKLGLVNPPADTFPNVGIGGQVPTGIGGGLNATLGFNTFMYSDSVTWIKGKHALKFGGEVNRWQDNQAWANIDAGDYDFSGVFTQNPADPNPPPALGYADFLLGKPDSWSVAMQPETGMRAWNSDAFVQDDVKLTSHLTVNAGLRYSMQTGWTEVLDRIGNFDPTLLNPSTGTLGAMCFAAQKFGTHQCPRAQQATHGFFQPRIGFAWAPKDTWSVRAGYGMFSQMSGANNYTTGFAYGWSVQGSITSGDNITPVFQFAQGPPTGSTLYPSSSQRSPDSLNGQGISYLPYHTPTPYVQQWTLDIQHQVRQIGLDVAYVGSRGVHLLFNRDIDQVPQALLGPGDSQANRPYPQFNGITANLYDANSNFHSLQMSIRRAGSHDFSFLVNYTLGKALDETTTQGWSGNINESYQDAYNPKANRGLAAFDIPRLLNGNVVYALPFGHGKRMLSHGGLTNVFAGGFQVSSTFQVHSGIPFTPTMAQNLTFSLAGVQYPNRIGRGTLPHPTPDAWFDVNAFVSPGLYKFGNSGRNILRGPDYRNLNISLSKHTSIKKLGKQGDFELRVDAYNALNHTNFGMPDPNIGDGTTGVISSTAGSFSNPSSRNLQLGAKLKF